MSRHCCEPPQTILERVRQNFVSNALALHSKGDDLFAVGLEAVTSLPLLVYSKFHHPPFGFL